MLYGREQLNRSARKKAKKIKQPKKSVEWTNVETLFIHGCEDKIVSFRANH